MTPDPHSLVFRHERHETVGSTNDLARQAACRGEAEGLWVLAERQTAGRGRHGRAWESPIGNFFGSLLLRPRRPLQELASLSLVMALAVAETVEHLARGGLCPQVKWPNDVLIGRAKFAGILLESGTDAGKGGMFLIVGLGVNLHHYPTDAPYPATSMAAEGLADLTPMAFLAALEPHLGACYKLWQREGFAGHRRRWLDRAAGLGQEIGLRVGVSALRGHFADLGADGTLQLADAEGRITNLSAGELFFPPGI